MWIISFVILFFFPLTIFQTITIHKVFLSIVSVTYHKTKTDFVSFLFHFHFDHSLDSIQVCFQLPSNPHTILRSIIQIKTTYIYTYLLVDKRIILWDRFESWLLQLDQRWDDWWDLFSNCLVQWRTCIKQRERDLLMLMLILETLATSWCKWKEESIFLLAIHCFVNGSRISVLKWDAYHFGRRKKVSKKLLMPWISNWTMSARPKRKNALCRFLSGGHKVSQAAKKWKLTS